MDRLTFIRSLDFMDGVQGYPPSKCGLRDLSDDDFAERVGEPILNFPSSQDGGALSSKAAEETE